MLRERKQLTFNILEKTANIRSLKEIPQRFTKKNSHVGQQTINCADFNVRLFSSFFFTSTSFLQYRPWEKISRYLRPHFHNTLTRSPESNQLLTWNTALVIPLLFSFPFQRFLSGRTVVCSLTRKHLISTSTRVSIVK